MVSFPGEVSTFRVVALGDALRGPYRVPSMRERVEEAEDRRDEQFRLFGEFRQANYDELLRVQRRLQDDPDAKLDSRQTELQRQWDAFREERTAVVASLREAEQALEWEIRCVTKSLQREEAPEYLAGETLTKEATIKVGAAEKSEETYMVTLTRYELKNSFGALVPTRWIVTSVEQAR
jgi:hypothetical protein